MDCFKTDFGERIPVNVVYHDGSDHIRAIIILIFIAKAVFNLLKKVKEKRYCSRQCDSRWTAVPSTLGW